MNIIYSFDPIIGTECDRLILGSMPGAESLAKKEYYGHGRNSFWKIMFELLGQKPTSDYESKKQMLVKNKIALWDVIQSCERNGSLDSAIKSAAANDFDALYKEYPNIRTVFFNGAKAYGEYRKKVGVDDGREYVLLPSTSPANAIKYDVKLDAWKAILR